MVEQKTRAHFGKYISKAEVAIYSLLAALLFVTAIGTAADAGKVLWEGLVHWTIATQAFQALDELLVVLMLVEILHTVRISIHSHVLAAEPFLIVGLIASVRRILVITLEAATLAKEHTWNPESAAIFRASMIELALLGVLVLVLVYSITLLRRHAQGSEGVEAG